MGQNALWPGTSTWLKVRMSERVAGNIPGLAKQTRRCEWQRPFFSYASTCLFGQRPNAAVI